MSSLALIEAVLAINVEGLGWALAGLVVVLPCLLPVLGMTGGQAYLQKEVVAPVACRGGPDSTVREGATCVTVCHKDLGEFRGRLVFATSAAVILYLPQPGQVLRVPLADAVVKSATRAVPDASACGRQGPPIPPGPAAAPAPAQRGRAGLVGGPKGGQSAMVRSRSLRS